LCVCPSGKEGIARREECGAKNEEGEGIGIGGVGSVSWRNRKKKAHTHGAEEGTMEIAMNGERREEKGRKKESTTHNKGRREVEGGERTRATEGESLPFVCWCAAVEC
jgi:hypothetical protein